MKNERGWLHSPRSFFLQIGKGWAYLKKMVIPARDSMAERSLSYLP